MRATLHSIIAASLASFTVGCSYLPYVVFSNPTESPLDLELQLEGAACPELKLGVLPSSHATRTWRSPDVRLVQPGLASLYRESCLLVARIPAKTALQIQIDWYYGWTGDQSADLAALASVSLDGADGVVSVSGPLVASYFENKGLARFVWVYGQS